jgi:hypothetical protein
MKNLATLKLSIIGADVHMYIDDSNSHAAGARNDDFFQKTHQITLCLDIVSELENERKREKSESESESESERERERERERG